MKSHFKQQGSITLGMVFGLGMLGISIAATTLLFSTSSVINNSNASSGLRTLITADSAGREGAYRVITSVVGQSTSFTGASIPTLNDTTTANNAVTGTWPVYTILAESKNERVTRKVVVDIDLFPSAFAFDQAVYTHGELDFNGNVTVAGDVYATDGIELGGSAEVTENAYTPDDIDATGAASVDGDSVDNHPVILPPTLDINPYRNQAISDGTYYGIGQGLVASNVIKNANISGTYFVEDSMSINGNTTDFDGVLLATGNVSLTGGDFTADGSNPLVLYVSGDLYVSGNIVINGIVYVEGETTFGNGTPVINGALISVNGANKATGGGNITINYDPVYAEAWLDIIGLDTESGNEPQMENWHEE